MDKLVATIGGQCKGGKFGSLRSHVEAGKLSEQTLHAEPGEIVAGKKSGRERCRNNPVLASRHLALKHRAWACDAREGRAPRPWSAPSFRVGDSAVRYVANAPIYSVNPPTRAGWADFFAFVSRASGANLQIIEHPFPSAAGRVVVAP